MRIRWLAALFAGGLAAGLGVGMTGTAHVSDPARAGEAWHEIFLPFGNAMCVDVAGGSTAADARLQLSRCHGYASNGAPQRWSFSGGRFHQMSNTNSGLCIGFPGGGPPVTGAEGHLVVIHGLGVAGLEMQVTGRPQVAENVVEDTVRELAIFRAVAEYAAEQPDQGMHHLPADQRQRVDQDHVAVQPGRLDGR